MLADWTLTLFVSIVPLFNIKHALYGQTRSAKDHVTPAPKFPHGSRVCLKGYQQVSDAGNPRLSMRNILPSSELAFDRYARDFQHVRRHRLCPM